MVIIDTDVLLLAFAFHNDWRQQTNSHFLQAVQTASPAVTIYTLMELLGKLSFNLSTKQLDAWPSWLVDAYQLTIVWPVQPDTAMNYTTFEDEIFARPFARMRAVKMPFLDSLILNLAERTPEAACFVSWNAKHFRDKSTLDVFTPVDYLEQFDPL
jgi:hypothetical protein